jgi:hypothetical protein
MTGTTSNTIPQTLNEWAKERRSKQLELESNTLKELIHCDSNGIGQLIDLIFVQTKEIDELKKRINRLELDELK